MRYAGSEWAIYYTRFAYFCYVAYYRVARYTEQLGTDPKTFAGFFFGILWEYPFYPRVRYAVVSTYLGVVAALPMTHGRITIREAVAYSVLDMMAIYLCVVAWFYFAYLSSQRKTIYSVKEDK
jgi:hypothetical protein